MEEPEIYLFYFKFKSQLSYDRNLGGLNTQLEDIYI